MLLFTHQLVFQIPNTKCFVIHQHDVCAACLHHFIFHKRCQLNTEKEKRSNVVKSALVHAVDNNNITVYIIPCY